MENNNPKHAYLIIAHNEEKVLQYLIKSIDDVRDDIYINIDKKSKELNEKELAKCLRYSNIYFLHEDVRWGDQSQVHCEILLMKKANKNSKYRYYHILSGVDCIVKSQDYIHNFFYKNDGKEFIHFDSIDVKNSEVLDRVKYVHLFSKLFKNSPNRYVNYFFVRLDKLCVDFQKFVGYEKNIRFNILQKGCNWCSITNDLVEYILKEEENINVMVKRSKCADELFIQTIVINSKFKNNLYGKSFNNDYRDCLRYIIWDDNDLKHPKLLDIHDYDSIINSDSIFARKVSSKNELCFELVKKIYKYIGGKE